MKKVPAPQVPAPQVLCPTNSSAERETAFELYRLKAS